MEQYSGLLNKGESDKSDRNNSKVFEYTGRQIPITLDKCISYVHRRLHEFDKCTIGKDMIENPYNSKIIMPIGNDRHIEIPGEIHAEAVRKWRSGNSKALTSADYTHKSKTTESFTTDETYNSHYIFIIILLASLGIIVYHYINNRDI